ncbi:response regulator [Arcobacter sp.]|uniref:response regulator n=1 Tax=Arcobacter sp. TaxID=1872629 RepID=UPI003D106452
MNNNFLNEIKILVVEDSETDRLTLVNILKKYFSNIIEASDGEVAYELFKKNLDIDIIISNINMPKISGIDFLKLVRTSDMNLPFIFITGRLEPEILLKAIDLNVSSYISKPINAISLLEKIDFLCEKKYYEKKLIKNQQEIEFYLEAVDKVALIFKMYGDGKISYMNNAMLEVLGYEEEKIKKLYFDEIIHPDIPRKYIDDTWEHVKNGKLWKGNTKFITNNKEIFYLNNTVFKINNEKEEFITIGFLTTKENLEKRDFHKKVILKFQESNRREFELKSMNAELQEKIEKLKALCKECEDSIKSLKEKNALNVRQLKHYELQGDNLTQKYEKFMNSKKDEIENYIKSLNIEKKKNEKLTFQKEELLELLGHLKEKNKNNEEEIRLKNIKINNLNELLLKKEESSKNKKSFF